MIKLSKEEYCDNCEDFDPVAFKITYVDRSSDMVKKCDTTVCCKYKDRCRRIAGFVKEGDSKDETWHI